MVESRIARKRLHPYALLLRMAPAMNHLETLQRVLRHDHPGWVPNGLGMALREIGFATVEWPEQAGSTPGASVGTWWTPSSAPIP